MSKHIEMAGMQFGALIANKFTGSVYERLGMKLSHISEPSYVWVDSYTNDVFTRYQTQKHKLVEQ